MIDSTDIRLFNYESLGQALRDQRSFYVQTNGLNDFAGVRGLLRPGEFNSSIVVTVDGRRPTPEYQARIDAAFVERDGRCCERTVAAIESLSGRVTRNRS